MEILWIFHKTFRGILFLQDASGSYLGIFKGPPSSPISYYTIYENNVVNLATKAMEELCNNIRYIVYVFQPSIYRQQSFYFRDGKKVKSLTEEIFDTLQEKLHIHFMTLPDYQMKDAKEKIHFSGKKYTRKSYATQQTLVENNITPISTIKFSQIFLPGRYYDCIQATTERNTVFVMVHQASNLPGWSLPLRVFSAGIWGALATTAVAYALAWRVITGDWPLRCVSATLAALSSCGSEEQSRIRALPQRLQLAGALLASSVVIATVYQGRLYSLVSEPERYPEMDTLEQLADSLIPIVTANGDFHYLYIADSITTDVLSPAQLRARERIFQRGLLEVTIEDMKMLVAEHRNVAFLIDSTWMVVSTNILFGRKVHKLKESVYDLDVCLILTKNWPWKDRVEQVISLMQQSGLYQHAAEMNTHVWKQFHPHRSRQIYEDDYESTIRVLQLADLLPHFYLLLVGILLSVTCLAGEIWYRRLTAPSHPPSSLTHSVEGVPQDPNPESQPPVPHAHSVYGVSQDPNAEHQTPAPSSTPPTHMALGAAGDPLSDI